MKKLLTVALIAVVACALAACSGNQDASQPAEEQQPAATQAVEGVVIDATMNQVTIADDQGNEHSYSLENAPSLPDDILLGMALAITADGDTITAMEEVPRTVNGAYTDQTETALTITDEAGNVYTFDTSSADIQWLMADGLKDGDNIGVTFTGGVETPGDGTADTSHAKVTTVERL